MTSNKYRPPKLNFFCSIALFIVGVTLYYSKLDSKENNVKPIQLTGLICILSSSLSIFVDMMTWICHSPFINDKIIQANTTSNEGLTFSNSGSENKIDTLFFNNEDATKNNFSQLIRKSWSAPVEVKFLQKMSDKKNVNNFDETVNHVTVPARPFSSIN